MGSDNKWRKTGRCSTGTSTSVLLVEHTGSTHWADFCCFLPPAACAGCLPAPPARHGPTAFELPSSPWLFGVLQSSGCFVASSRSMVLTTGGCFAARVVVVGWMLCHYFMFVRMLCRCVLRLMLCRYGCGVWLDALPPLLYVGIFRQSCRRCIYLSQVQMFRSSLGRLGWWVLFTFLLL